jgi:uncharacterized protein YcbK (DUF882 family)
MATAAGLAMPSVISTTARAAASRSIAFESLHTGERLSTVYWADGNYIADALKRVDVVLRDHRNDKVHAVDPQLVDLLHRLRSQLDTTAPFRVISGYRSPESNAMLHAASNGVASNSLHTRGIAIDVRMPGVQLAQLRDAAKALQGGGVGYYPKSDFVHVDTGRVRSW